MYEKSKQFFNSFNSIFDTENPLREIAVSKYPDNTAFTEFIISQIESIIKEQPIDQKEVYAQKEYFRIDAIGYTSSHEKLPENFTKKSRLKEHLWDLEIAVEHENDSTDWLDEVIKLAHVCCPLRVVIGYVPCNTRQDDMMLLDYVAQALKKLKCRQNLLHGEFLIILGNSNTKGKQENYFNYKPYVLDTKNCRFIEL